MRQFIAIAAVLLSASPAFAQSLPSYIPQQEANVSNYPTPPTSYPQTQPAYAAPAPQPVQQQPYYDPRPTDAGQSVVTDVRQMNF